VFPEALGNGLPWVQLCLSPILGTRFVAVLLAVTFVLVLLAGGGRLYGSQLLPAMMMGGLAGLLLTKLVPVLAPPPEAAVISGLCALLAGVARAPFAAIVLAGEMGDYSLLLLVIITAFVSYTFTSPRGSLEPEAAELEPEGSIEAGPEPPVSASASRISDSA
jgi:CIC family chloride channel protein